ncbi:hypothetical protein ACJX0J_036085, partial [Zea mays]
TFIVIIILEINYFIIQLFYKTSHTLILRRWPYTELFLLENFIRVPFIDFIMTCIDLEGKLSRRRFEVLEIIARTREQTHMKNLNSTGALDGTNKLYKQITSATSIHYLII